MPLWEVADFQWYVREGLNRRSSEREMKLHLRERREQAYWLDMKPVPYLWLEGEDPSHTPNVLTHPTHWRKTPAAHSSTME